MIKRKNNGLMGSGPCVFILLTRAPSFCSLPLWCLVNNIVRVLTMGCDEFCKCLLCLELKGCETNLKSDNSDNFILTKSEAINNDCFEPTKYTFFGMEPNTWFNNNEGEDENQNKVAEVSCAQNGEPTENKHKSVIYVNDDLQHDATSVEDSARITIKEKIDELMTLDSIENSHVINVIFKNTFSWASQIIDDVRTCNEYYSDSSDDFPLGMEADLLKYYLEQKR
jgi:hypothetical protein